MDHCKWKHIGPLKVFIMSFGSDPSIMQEILQYHCTSHLDGALALRTDRPYFLRAILYRCRIAITVPSTITKQPIHKTLI